MNTLSHEGLFPSIEFVMIPCLFSSPEGDVEDSDVAYYKEEIDDQNGAEKVKKMLSLKKLKIYEARCLFNITFCGASASI